MSVVDKVAVVTGGASGIGEGCVRKLWSLGYMVEILDRQSDQATRLADELNLSSNRVKFRYVDVADPHHVEERAQEIWNEYQGPEVQVTSAGIVVSSANILDTDLEVQDRVRPVNYL